MKDTLRSISKNKTIQQVKIGSTHSENIAKRKGWPNKKSGTGKVPLVTLTPSAPIPQVHLRWTSIGGDPSAASATDTLFIATLLIVTQLRLLPTCDSKIRHRPMDDTSPQTRSHGATGGVCKKQGRILRAIVTRGY